MAIDLTKTANYSNKTVTFYQNYQSSNLFTQRTVLDLKLNHVTGIISLIDRKSSEVLLEADTLYNNTPTLIAKGIQKLLDKRYIYDIDVVCNSLDTIMNTIPNVIHILSLRDITATIHSQYNPNAIASPKVGTPVTIAFINNSNKNADVANDYNAHINMTYTEDFDLLHLQLPDTLDTLLMSTVLNEDTFIKAAAHLKKLAIESTTVLVTCCNFTDNRKVIIDKLMALLQDEYLNVLDLTAQKQVSNGSTNPGSDFDIDKPVKETNATDKILAKNVTKLSEIKSALVKYYYTVKKEKMIAREFSISHISKNASIHNDAILLIENLISKWMEEDIILDTNERTEKFDKQLSTLKKYDKVLSHLSEGRLTNSDRKPIITDL